MAIMIIIRPKVKVYQHIVFLILVCAIRLKHLYVLILCVSIGLTILHYYFINK